MNSVNLRLGERLVLFVYHSLFVYIPPPPFFFFAEETLDIDYGRKNMAVI